jgi:hypothetical protein
MMAEEAVAPVAQREGRLELPTHRQGGHRQPVRQPQRQRRQSARSPPRDRSAVDHPHHRVIAAQVDRPVVGQEAIGHPRQPAARVAIFVGDRIVDPVAGGHHQRQRRHLGEQQAVQRRGGQHQPHQRRVRRDLSGQRRGARTLAHQHDRSRRRAQQRLLLRREQRQLGGRGEIADHHRERLLLPLLALSQGGHRARVRGVARQVVAAQPLHRHHPAGAEHRSGAAQRIARAQPAGDRHPLLVPQRQPRAALRAGDRLRVEAAILRVHVLAQTGHAEREVGQGGGRPVVRQRAHHGEARAAAGAIEEGVAEAAVARIAQLAQTIVARRNVCRDEHLGLAPLVGVLDPELQLPARRTAGALHRLDLSQGWGPALQPIEEQAHCGQRPLHLDQHRACLVAHEAAQPQPRGQLVHEGSEPHPLDHPGDPDGPSRCLDPR